MRHPARRAGIGLVACLLGAVAAAASFMLPPALQHGSSRFNGTPAQALMVWGVLSAVLVFGATATVYGAWTVATGKRNLTVAYVMVGIFSASYLLAQML